MCWTSSADLTFTTLGKQNWEERCFFFLGLKSHAEHFLRCPVHSTLSSRILEFISDGRKSRDDIDLPTHLTARQTEAQRGKLTCRRTHSKWVAEPGFDICILFTTSNCSWEIIWDKFKERHDCSGCKVQEVSREREFLHLARGFVKVEQRQPAKDLLGVCLEFKL